MENRMSEGTGKKVAVNPRMAQLQTLVESIIFKDKTKGLDFA